MLMRPPLHLRINVDQSAHRGLTHWFLLHCWWLAANCLWRNRWAGVKGGRAAADLDLKPSSRKRLLVVWLLTVTFVAFRCSFWSALASVVLSLRSKKIKNRFYCLLVDLVQPGRRGSWTLPVVCHRSQSRWMTKWVTPSRLPTPHREIPYYVHARALSFVSAT